nr:DUF4291 family protein [Snodgrassella alvi]
MFVHPLFKAERMTWFKPFLWMMYPSDGQRKTDKNIF